MITSINEFAKYLMVSENLDIESLIKTSVTAEELLGFAKDNIIKALGKLQGTVVYNDKNYDLSKAKYVIEQHKFGSSHFLEVKMEPFFSKTTKMQYGFYPTDSNYAKNENAYKTIKKLVDSAIKSIRVPLVVKFKQTAVGVVSPFIFELYLHDDVIKKMRAGREKTGKPGTVFLTIDASQMTGRDDGNTTYMEGDVLINGDSFYVDASDRYMMKSEEVYNAVTDVLSKFKIDYSNLYDELHLQEDDEDIDMAWEISNYCIYPGTVTKFIFDSDGINVKMEATADNDAIDFEEDRDEDEDEDED